MAICKAFLVLLFAGLASAFPCDESIRIGLPLARPKASFGSSRTTNAKYAVLPFRRTYENNPHQIHTNNQARPRPLPGKQQVPTLGDIVTLGDTTRPANLPLPYLKSPSHTYTQPNATLQDLGHQLQRWQHAAASPPGAALLTIGVADARLAALRAACSPPTDHSSCETALHGAHARIAGIAAGQGRLRRRLANGIRNIVVHGRASGGTTFRVYVAGYDSVTFVVGLTDVRAAGVRSVVAALNEALAESVREINMGFGVEVAVFVPQDGGSGVHGHSRGTWAHTGL